MDMWSFRACSRSWQQETGSAHAQCAQQNCGLWVLRESQAHVGGVFVLHSVSFGFVLDSSVSQNANISTIHIKLPISAFI